MQPGGASDPKIHPGAVLAGRYRLERRIGGGGMGEVWEGRQVTTDKRVAIKLLRSDDGTDTARFLREARVAAALSHRNIVQVFDFWDVEGGCPAFMVMELLAGETLAAQLTRVGRLSFPETMSVVLPVASALGAAHARGVVHRDLKPENVFLSRSSESDPVEVKVVDFGLAKPMAPDRQTTAITQTGAVMGTPYYMAPEQVYGEKDVDPRADVWALGVVVHECMGGAPPFTGENFGQVFRRISQEAPPPLREVAPDAPPWLEELVAAMLSHDREKRPSMARVHETLLHPPASVDSARPSAQTTTVQVTHRLPPPAAVRHGTPARLPAATRTTASTSVRSPRTSASWLSPVVIAGSVVALVVVGVGTTVALRPGAARPVSVDLGALPAATIATTTATTTAPPPKPAETEEPTSPTPNASSPSLAASATPAAPAARARPTAAPSPLARGRF
jgi:eukaryotic-like serine/threonine-protein kinase